LKGETGSGKTLFARFLVDELLESDEFVDLVPPKQQAIFCSSLNSESAYKFLNIWQPILVQLLTQLAKRTNTSRQQIVYNFIISSQGGSKNLVYTEALCKMFRIDFKLMQELAEFPIDCD
jgi:Cdc6-like AAA superfamily ATPase